MHICSTTLPCRLKKLFSIFLKASKYLNKITQEEEEAPNLSKWTASTQRTTNFLGPADGFLLLLHSAV